MVSVGDVVVIEGKPQIVESTFNGGYVSRPAQPSELTNRSLPASIDPAYNPNLPQNQNPPPAAPQEVKVLGEVPSAQDEASMYAEGYEYKGQSGNQQVWQRWNQPKAAGTYASIGGGSWMVEDIGQVQVMQEGKPAATFYGGQNIYYETKPAPSREGQLPPGPARTAAGLQPWENPFSPVEVGEVGVANPFRPGEIIITDPRQSFATYSVRQPILAESAPGILGESFSKLYNISTSAEHYQEPAWAMTRGVLTIPEAISGTITIAATEGLVGITKQMGQTIKFTTSEAMAGRYGAAYEIIGQAAFTEGILRGVGKAGSYLKGKLITEKLYYISPEVDKTAVINPAAEKAGFISETSGYVIRMRTILGRMTTEEVVGLGKIRAAGVIEKVSDSQAVIKGKGIGYEIGPEVVKGENIDIVAKAEQKTIMEYPGGLKKTAEKVGVMEKASGFTAEETSKRAAAGAFNILNKEIIRGTSKAVNVKTFEAGETKGILVEMEKSISRTEPKATFRRTTKGVNLDTAGSIEELRKPGMPEVDFMESRSRAAKPMAEPEWLFDAEKIAKRQKVKEPSPISPEEAAQSQAKSIMNQLPKPYQEKGLIFEQAEMAKPKQLPRGSVKAITSMQNQELLRNLERTGEKAAPKSPAISPKNILRQKQPVAEKVSEKQGRASRAGEASASSEKSKINSSIRMGIFTASPRINDLAQGQGLSLRQQQALSQRTAQETTTKQDRASRFKLPEIPGGRMPRVPIGTTRETPGIFIKGRREMPAAKKTRAGDRFKSLSEKVRYRKHDELKPSPIQADVSKFKYGKASAPKPTRKLLAKATISVPTREQVMHRRR